MVSRNTLTSVKDSMLRKLFTGSVNLKKIHDGEQIFLDRDPVVFNHMINYLRSNRKFLPKDLPPDLRHQLDLELKFWKVSGDLVENNAIDGRVEGTHQKLVEIMSS
jgi:hypothetical protein